MDDVDAVDLGAFLRELRYETDRGLALVSAAMIDEKLAQTLEAFFQNDAGIAQRILGTEPRREAPLSSLSARADAALALGLIELHEYGEIALIRKIRNEFAHSRHGTTFESPGVAKLCLKLKSVPPGNSKPTARMRFAFATVATYMRLYSRPHAVARERRQAKAWLAPGHVDWSPNPGHNALIVLFDKEGGPETVTIDFGMSTPAS